MHTTIRFTIAIVLALFACLCVAADKNWSIESSSYLLPPKPFRAPLGGDVFFSTRKARLEAPQIAQVYGANRMEWIYSNDAKYVDFLKMKGYLVGLTLNANPKIDGNEGYARDFNGEVVIAPWMKSWGAKWATAASTKTVSIILDEARKLVASHADSIQFDDPDLQFSTTKWADGDFSNASLAGFNKFIQRADILPKALQVGLNPGAVENYKDFLIRTYDVKSAADYIRRKKTFLTTPLWERYLMFSVREFHVTLKKLLSSEQSRYTPLSFNLDIQPEEQSLFLADIPDYVIAESHDFDATEIAIRTATARAVPTGYVASIMPKGLAYTRRSIAMHYAFGAPAVVPWDVYMPDINAVPQPRYFAKAEDFADLFQFARGARQLLDHSEIPSAVVIAVPIAKLDRTELRRVVGLLTQHSIPFVFAFSGGVFKTFSLDGKNLSKAKTIIRLDPIGGFNEPDINILNSLGNTVLPASMITESWATRNSPVKVDNADGVVSNFRIVNPRTGTVALHLIAPVKESKPEKKEGPLVIKITREFLPRDIKRGQLYSIGKPTESIPISINKGEVLLSIPYPETWSILSFSNDDL